MTETTGWKHWAPMTALALILTTPALTGCKSGLLRMMGMTPAKTSIAAEITATPGVNPDINGRPSPIVVRLYELRASGMFEGADFFSLYESENEALGGDLLGREEFELQPGGSRTWERSLAADARYLGVLGAYRGLDQAQWRVTYKLQPESENKISIEIGDRAITIQER
ncbi:MAG TPA: type VI secretion system lipoprotein TssJ [Sedimenticola sp.]|nr:type VI secretion system lipoprotein TssJ [Sedimenticola sp.]